MLCQDKNGYLGSVLEWRNMFINLAGTSIETCHNYKYRSVVVVSQQSMSIRRRWMHTVGMSCTGGCEGLVGQGTICSAWLGRSTQIWLWLNKKATPIKGQQHYYQCGDVTLNLNILNYVTLANWLHTVRLNQSKHSVIHI